MRCASTRPTLSCIGSPADDVALEISRQQNDLALKSRFEQIFIKYSHDFVGVGDEVDLETGQIVVNNGHLERMTNEKDIGGVSTRVASSYGQSLLRAMTVAPEDPEFVYPTAREVVQSIETIADTFVTIDDSSEDDLFDQSLKVPLQHFGDSGIQRNGTSAPSTLFDDSDHDSLVGCQPRRYSSSGDSLFGGSRLSEDVAEVRHDAPEHHELQKVEVHPEYVRQHRELLREEIRSIIAEQEEARVEEAWRLPPHISSNIAVRHRLSDNLASSKQRSSDDRSQPSSYSQNVSSQDGVSLWAGPQRYRRTNKQIATDRARANARAESLDPLQEDFVNTDHDMASSTEDEYLPPGRRKRRKISTLPRRIRSHSSTVHHSDKTSSSESIEQPSCDQNIKSDPKHKPTADPYDHETLRTITVEKQRSGRPKPRLFLSDFRILVELHEGFGLSFDQIARCNVLHMWKTGLKWNEIYDSWRNVPIPNHQAQPSTQWNASEEQIIEAIINDSNATMTRFKTELTTRDDLEIGDKLAETFLHELHEKYKGNLPSKEEAVLALKNFQLSVRRKNRAHSMTNFEHEHEPEVSIKQED